MPSPTEKALKEVAKELRASRKMTQAVLNRLGDVESSVKGLRVALAEFHHDVEARHQSHEQAVAGLSSRVLRAERALKLRPA